MADFDLFLSYASVDLPGAEALEQWLQAPPRNRTIWRDRRGILPGAPDYYPPIRAGISASATFMVLLSPRWLASSVAAKELEDARSDGKKIIVVVHAAIPRDPETAQGRELKAELMQALGRSDVRSKLERPNWIWLRQKEAAEPDYPPVEQAVATDFTWAARHAIIVQRLHRWQEVGDETALLRGSDLVELMADAFADVEGRQPVLTEEERRFLLESQRYDAEESEREQAMYWGAQARAAAFAARERGEAEPGLALLLAAEGASVATVPEARAALLSLLHRHARLTRVIGSHGWGRSVCGVAFSRDGCWLASVDEERGIGDDRPAYLLLHDAETGREERRVASDESMRAVAWGSRWLAVASPGSIGWLRWDEWKGKFRGNTPSALGPDTIPDLLAFSPHYVEAAQDEVLAWGTRWGELGLIRVGDHLHVARRQLTGEGPGAALVGLGWLGGDRLITAEHGRLMIRPVPQLEPAQEIAALDLIFSLESDGERWVVACRKDGSTGLLVGKDSQVTGYRPIQAADIDLIAVFAGPSTVATALTGSGTRRSGAPAVALRQDASASDTLLAGEDEQASDTLLAGEDEQVQRVAADPDGKFAAAGDRQGNLWLWNRGRRSHLVREVLKGTAVRCLAASRGERCALATADGRVQVFAGSFSGEPLVEIPVEPAPTQLLFADGGDLLLAADEQGRLVAIDIEGRAESCSLPVSPQYIAPADGAPVIATLEANTRIGVLRLSRNEGSLVWSTEVEPPVLGLALDSTGQRVFAAFQQDGFLEVRCWRLDAAPQESARILSLTSGIPVPTSIALTRGDLAVISDDDDVVFVPLDAPGDATRRQGHDEPVRRVVAGTEVVASLASRRRPPHFDEVRLWTPDGQPLGPVLLPGSAVDMAMSPDGSALVVLGDGGVCWSVTLRIDDWIATARRIGGELSADQRRRYGIDAWRERETTGLPASNDRA